MELKLSSKAQVKSKNENLLEEELIDRARKLTGIKTKKQVVQEALRILTQLKRTGTGAVITGYAPLGRRS